MKRIEEAEGKKRRLGGFLPVTGRDMTKAILGISPRNAGPTQDEQLAQLPRGTRRKLNRQGRAAIRKMQKAGPRGR